jgi:hypothetical protein
MCCKVTSIRSRILKTSSEEYQIPNSVFHKQEVVSRQQMPVRTAADTWNRDEHLLANSQVQCLTEEMTQVLLLI